MTTVLKLGGSVITEKDHPETIDEASLDRAADAVARALESAAVADLVIVHGGGSFGHHHAARHGVSTTTGTHDVTALAAIHEAMKALNEAVLERLIDRDVPVIPIHPLSVAHYDEAGRLVFPTGVIEAVLGEGFVPVLHGDGVVGVGVGVRVASGDELVVKLADALDADRVGVCSTVPGVLDDDGLVIDRIDDYEVVEAVLGESEATDVTGGMAGKVRTLLDLRASASIFGLEGLESFLEGGAPGTTIG